MAFQIIKLVYFQPHSTSAVIFLLLKNKHTHTQHLEVGTFLFFGFYFLFFNLFVTYLDLPFQA